MSGTRVKESICGQQCGLPDEWLWGAYPHDRGFVDKGVQGDRERSFVETHFPTGVILLWVYRARHAASFRGPAAVTLPPLLRPQERGTAARGAAPSRRSDSQSTMRHLGKLRLGTCPPGRDTPPARSGAGGRCPVSACREQFIRSCPCDKLARNRALVVAQSVRAPAS